MPSNLEKISSTEAANLLKWQLEMGVDCATMPESVDRFASFEPPKSQIKQPAPQEFKPAPVKQNIAKPIAKKALAEGDRAAFVKEAEAKAKAANSLDAIFQALDGFENCPLRRTAMNTVKASGKPDAEIMVITEPPESEEERAGIQGAGQAGELLNKMLGAIGLSSSENVYVANIIPWRLLGNKEPDTFELQLCTPFIRRQIDLVNPKAILLLGRVGVQALLELDEPISKSRGNWHAINIADQTFETLVSYGPLYLLNRPTAKKDSWVDLKAFKKKIDAL